MPTFSRRRFVSHLALAASATVIRTGASAAESDAAKRIRAVAFDAFPIFDPRPIGAVAEKKFPGRGNELMSLWRARQFEYTWLRMAMVRYADFWQVTGDALDHAARQLHLPLSGEARSELLHAHLTLKAWPDVLPVLHRLRTRGLRLGFLSNFTPAMLDADIASAGLDGSFEQVLSTDAARTYKPDPRAYQLGLDRFGAAREEILFVAFAGWDAVGAKAFGYPTFWVNRLGLAAESLGVTPDGEGRDLVALEDFLTRIG